MKVCTPPPSKRKSLQTNNLFLIAIFVCPTLFALNLGCNLYICLATSYVALQNLVWHQNLLSILVNRLLL